MSFDSIRGVTVLFGGYFRDGNNTPYYYGDTWEWDGNTWALISTTGPAQRFSHSMAFDIGHARTLLFGGSFDDHFDLFSNETWAWDGSSWTLVSMVGPTPREGCAISYDASLGRTVLMGGKRTNGITGETWEYGAPPRGDLNRDGFINNGDADLFAAVLLGLDSDSYRSWAADMNESGEADGDDIAPFVHQMFHP
jgi:hypothetical protein